MPLAFSAYERLRFAARAVFLGSSYHLVIAGTGWSFAEVLPSYAFLMSVYRARGEHYTKRLEATAA